jgi:hypothetical protein
MRNCEFDWQNLPAIGVFAGVFDVVFAIARSGAARAGAG